MHSRGGLVVNNNDIKKFSDDLVLAAPQRQPLYRVAPKHLDGRYLECISSYLSNCAAEHGTSPNIFLTDIVGVAAKEFLDKRRAAFAVKSFAQRLDGTTDFAVRFVEMISRLSGVSGLEAHTLNFLAPITSRRGFLRSDLAWCPTFLEALSKPYIPILWRFQWIKVCSRFRVPLHIRCPKCGKAVNVLSARGKVGFCTEYSCQADLSTSYVLGKSSTTIESYKSMDYEVWVSDQTEALLSSLRKDPLPEDYSLADTLNYWFDAFGLTGTRGFGPKYFGVQGNSLGMWTRGTSKPKIEHLFNFAWVMQLKIDDFLRKRMPVNHDGKLVESLAVLTNESSGFVRRPMDHEKIRGRLSEIMCNNEFYYDSFTDIAKKIGRSVGALRDAFPAEAKAISQRFKMNRKVRARLRHAADRAEIIEACKVIAEMGEVISARRVKAMISKPSTVIDPKFGGALIKHARQNQIAGRTLEKVAN